MALKYDFDMFDQRGNDGGSGGKHARFRDLNAVRFLRGASEEVKNCLLESGFELNVYDSGAGPGYYPASDGPARARVIERLMENLEELPEGADWNGFDIEAFAMAALLAKPLDVSAQAPKAMPRPRSDVPPAATARPEAPAPSMDSFFSNQPSSRSTSGQPAAPDMDSFFSNRKISAPPAPESAGPDMDSFFSNVRNSRASATTPAPMTADDIRMNIDTAPPKKVGLGPVKMVLLALGLFAVVTVLGNGTGMDKLVDLATGGKIVSVDR